MSVNRSVLTPLTSNLIEEEQIKLSNMKQYLQGDETAKLALEANITGLGYQQLYRLTSADYSLQSFCRHSVSAQEQWSNKYLQKDYLSIPIKTLEGNDFMIYDLIMGMALYSEAIDAGVDRSLKKTLIDAACDWNFYDALVLRCTHNLKALKTYKDKAKDDLANIAFLEINDLKDQIETDVATLKNYYWQIGHFQSGLILNQLSTELSTIVRLIAESLPELEGILEAPEYREQITNLSEDADEFILQAIEAYFMAEEFDELPESKLITDEITKGKGIQFLLAESKLGSWSQAAEMFSGWITTEDGRLYQNSSTARETLAAIKQRASTNVKNLYKKFKDIEVKSTTNAKEEMKFLSELKMSSFFNRPICEVANDVSSKLKRKLRS